MITCVQYCAWVCVLLNDMMQPYITIMLGITSYQLHWGVWLHERWGLLAIRKSSHLSRNGYWAAVFSYMCMLYMNLWSNVDQNLLRMYNFIFFTLQQYHCTGSYIAPSHPGLLKVQNIFIATFQQCCHHLHQAVKVMTASLKCCNTDILDGSENDSPPPSGRQNSYTNDPPALSSTLATYSHHASPPFQVVVTVGTWSCQVVDIYLPQTDV